MVNIICCYFGDSTSDSGIVGFTWLVWKMPQQQFRQPKKKVCDCLKVYDCLFVFCFIKTSLIHQTCAAHGKNGGGERAITKARVGGTVPARISQDAVHIPEGFSPDTASLGSEPRAGTAGILCSHLREGLVRTTCNRKVIAFSQQIQLCSQNHQP